MLTTVPIAVLVGTVLGFLSGLGVGGGTVLILWLTQVIGFDSTLSRAMNLLFFITTAGVVSMIRLKTKQISWRSIWPAMITGCITAGIFTLISEFLDPNVLRKTFGILLLIVGIKELLYRAK